MSSAEGSRSRGAGGGRARFQAGKFQYNARVGAALVPALVVILDYGGSVVAGALVVGAMVSYMLDALRLREGALTAVWATLIAANLGLMFSGVADTPNQPMLLSLLVLGTCGICLFLTGVWGSLQFRWLQLQHPGVAVAGERALFGACPIAGTAVVTWGVVAAVGAGSAPYYLAVVGCLYYWLFALPVPSSFLNVSGGTMGGRLQEDDYVQGHTEGVLQCVTLLFMPVLYHVGTHWAVIFHWVHVWSALGLLAVPMLFLSFTVQRGGLWFLGLGEWQEGGVQRFLLLASLVALVAAVEGRVVFHSYSQYIFLHPPWSYLLVTLALYCGGALIGAHFTGMIGYRLSPAVAMVFLCTAALAGGVVTGIPLLVMPAPLVAAGGLALFYESRSLRDYIIFVCGALLSAAWFVLHNFWFLDAAVGGVPLRTICKLAMAALVMALLAPGLAICNPSRGVTGTLLLLQAGLVCAAEDLLYSATHDEPEGLYPGYLVLITSGLGVLLARRLQETGRLPGLASWAMQCIYVSKLTVLLIPEARLLVSAVPLALSATPPLLLYKERRAREARMKAWQGFLHAASIVAAAAHARFAVFDVCKYLMQRRPTDGLVLGALLAFCGVACMPIATGHFPFAQGAKRAAVLTTAAGLMLVMLQPPLPVHGGARCPHLPFGLCPRIWDEKHVPLHEVDSSAIWGGGIERHERWPAWLLVAAVLSGLGAASSGIALARSSPLRLMFASAMGSSAGAYVALEYFPHQHVLQLMVLAAVLLAAVFLVFLQMPSASSPRSLPWVFGAVAALLPLSLAAQAHLPPPPLHAREARLFADVEEDRIAETRAALLASFACLHMLLAFSVKVRTTALARDTPAARRAAAPNRARAYMGVVPRAPAHRAHGAAARWPLSLFMGKLGPAEGTEWMAVTGNVATLLAFGACLVLNAELTEGSDASAFAIAPILLLLHHGAGTTERQRYLPPVAAVSAFLAVSALLQVTEEVWSGQGVFYAGPVWPYVLKNVGSLLLVLPNHVMFCRFLGDIARHSEWLLLVLTPLNVPPLLLTDVQTIRTLAATGIAVACVQYFSSRRIKRSGLQYV